MGLKILVLLMIPFICYAQPVKMNNPESKKQIKITYNTAVFFNQDVSKMNDRDFKDYVAKLSLIVRDLLEK